MRSIGRESRNEFLSRKREGRREPEIRMAVARSRNSVPRVDANHRAASVRLAAPGDVATLSAERRQQALHDGQWRVVDAAAAEPPGRWPHRRTLAFIGLTCGGFWACVILGAAQLLR